MEGWAKEVSRSGTKRTVAIGEAGVEVNLGLDVVASFVPEHALELVVVVDLKVLPEMWNDMLAVFLVVCLGTKWEKAVFYSQASGSRLRTRRQ